MSCYTHSNGHPHGSYRDTLMHLISGVCVAYYEFPGGTAFQMKRSADILTSLRLRTASVPHVSSYLATLHILGPQLSTQIQSGPLTEGWNCISGRPRQTWLRTVESDVASVNIGLATAYHKISKHGGRW